MRRAMTFDDEVPAPPKPTRKRRLRTIPDRGTIPVTFVGFEKPEDWHVSYRKFEREFRDSLRKELKAQADQILQEVQEGNPYAHYHITHEYGVSRRVKA